MAEEVAGARIARSESAFWHLMKRLFRNKAAVFGLVIIMLMFLCAIAAPLIATHDYAKQDLPSMLQSPSRAHLFGTDEFGRDIFSRVIYGSRVSLKVGFLAVGISLFAGLLLGREKCPRQESRLEEKYRHRLLAYGRFSDRHFDANLLVWADAIVYSSFQTEAFPDFRLRDMEASLFACIDDWNNRCGFGR